MEDGSAIFWVMGFAVAAISMIGGVIVRDRQVTKMINEGDEKLHQRINLIQHDYVRRDDLNGHIQTIENTVNQMREEQRETNRRIDNLLTVLSNKE